ncbi:MAG: hypothetical protein JXA06_00880 [Bacteroidetes bacterium]|nr:hypothetical protein [Bacteroidota bacterium]
MAQRLQVTYVDKTSTSIVNVGGDGWKMAQSEAIIKILSGSIKLYIIKYGKTIDVEVAQKDGILYLKSQKYSIGKDYLLSLPECH